MARRPDKLAAPIADNARAAPLAGTPRSVSNADMCVSAPFWAMDCAKRTTTRIQKTRDVTLTNRDAVQHRRSAAIGRTPLE